MTSINGADFVHFVMQALAPASQNGQSRAENVDDLDWIKRRKRQRKARAARPFYRTSELRDQTLMNAL